MHFAANAGHIACSLSCIDILICVLFRQKSVNDSFILSKGHAASALYACLNQLGQISSEELKTFYQNGTSLSAHPAPLKFDEIPFATGSLGHGFPIGAGIAMANKLDSSNNIVYVVMSDGETNEGTTWEAAHFSSFHNLDNIILIVDNNNLQGFGRLEDTLGNTAAKHKWEAMGFEVAETDGHNVSTLCSILDTFKVNKNGKPKVIIGSTIKGKGIKFMENKLEWHYLPMTNESYQVALSEISQRYSS